MQQVLFGMDVFLQQAHAYKNKRIAVVTNDAALTARGVLNRVALLLEGLRIVKIFSPEHGISCSAADGAAQNNHTDAVTRLPVLSLYGSNFAPAEEDLQDIDLVLFDIPDAGCRFYTYLWTMTHVMEACARYNKPLVILDRPNPTGALIEHAEGPFLDETHCSSFIGRWNIPVKHCCTLGELALYFTAQKNIPLHLSVIKAAGYQRHFTAQHHFLFTPTSPAIQNFETALLYPGTGLLEGIHVNEGRGTATPFMRCGAPFIDKEKLLQQWQQKNMPGIAATACSYTPAESVYANQLCHGLQFTICNAALVKPVFAGITLLQLLLQLYPQQITQRLYCTAANPTGHAHLDKLLGIQNSFDYVKNGGHINTAVADVWQQQIKEFLLY
jgi:uncharacterized protein YbbC (DUF1343 family)